MAELSPQELLVLRRRLGGELLKAIAADLDITEQSAAEYQKRGAVKFGFESFKALEAHLVVSEKIAEALRQTDGDPSVSIGRRMSREELRKIRAAASSGAAIAAVLTGILARVEGDDGQAR